MKRENGSRKEKRICSTSGKLHCTFDAGEDEDFLEEKFIPNLLFVCQNWIKSKYDLEKNG